MEEITEEFEYILSKYCNICLDLFTNIKKYISSIKFPLIPLETATKLKLGKNYLKEDNRPPALYYYRKINFNYLLHAIADEKIPSYLEKTKIKQLRELHAKIEKNIDYSTIEKFLDKFELDNKEIGKKWLSHQISLIENATKQSVYKLTMFAPLENVSLIEYEFLNGIRLRKLSKDEYIEYIERDYLINSETYINTIPASRIITVMVYTISNEIDKNDYDYQNKIYEIKEQFNLTFDMILIVSKNPLYFSRILISVDNPYALVSDYQNTTHIISERPSYNKLLFHLPPISEISNEELGTISALIEKVNALTKLKDETNYYLNILTGFMFSLRRLKIASKRENDVDSIMDSVIGLEILLTKENERDNIVYKVARRGSFLTSESGVRIKEANKLSELYNIRSILVHSGKKIKTKNVKKLLGEIKEVFLSDIRWIAFNMLKNVLLGYIYFVIHLYPQIDDYITIKNNVENLFLHDKLILTLDDMILQGHDFKRRV